MVRAPRWATILCALSFAVLLLTARTRCQERSRLIQNEDGVVANDGAGNPDTLPLSARQCFSALADPRMIFNNVVDWPPRRLPGFVHFPFAISWYFRRAYSSLRLRG